MKIPIFVKRNKGVFFVIGFSVVLIMIIVGLFRIDNSINHIITDYVQGLGWRVEDSPQEIIHMTLPQKFDAVYQAYNTIQKNAGFEFEKYRGKKVIRYSYKVLNHRLSDE